MESKFGFTLLTLTEFETWIQKQNVARTVLYIQEHHTWSPSYVHFKGNNHFDLQHSMQHTHMFINGWRDIGQHFSIFPDGKIVTGRDLELTPACIYGNNRDAVCIENVGNFDTGNDQMSDKQRDAIIRVTAALCKRFRIPTNTNRIVYHHWFHLSTGVRNDGAEGNKSCPGTNFFGGNSVDAARQHFLPLVNQALMGAPVPAPAPAVLYYGYVTSDWLNIRDRPAAGGNKLNSTPFGSILRVYEEKNGWCRISASKQEWVSGRYVQPVKRGTVSRTDDLNVRTGPGTQFAKIRQVHRDEEVFVFEQQGSWMKISVDEQWVSGNFVAVA